MIPEIKDNTKYSYADYLTWTGEERFELINGEVWDMSYGCIGVQVRPHTRAIDEVYDQGSLLPTSPRRY